jgi:anti-anti-sigma factor
MLHLDRRVERGVLVLTPLDAELRMETDCAALRHEFLNAVAEAQGKHVVLDMRKVRYLASAAYRPLLSLRQACAGAGVRLLLCNLNQAVASIFYATGLINRELPDESPFQERPDLPTALAYLNGEAV